MKILVTGDRGYIGSILTQMLEEKSYEVVGYDIDYYQETDLYPTKRTYKQITKDIRHISSEDIEGMDAVIHLAGLSNDPLGELNPNLTVDINFKATVKLAKLSKEAGVKRFIYSSSQSMYGISGSDDELDEYDSEKKPLTAYAKTKWDAELKLREIGNSQFIVSCFRPSTVFGASPRLRCDIVFNNLVACAYTTGKIEIKSDGTPWRPVVHVRDVSNAYIAGLEAPAHLVSNKSFNVGIPNGNYTVRDLAEAAQKVVPGSTLSFTGEHGSDTRTYKVGFQRILTELKGYFNPEWDLIRGGQELIELFQRVNFTEEQFRGPSCIRLMKLNQMTQSNVIDKNLIRI
jgi:nucleoside-diphosphate-sugar epimerase